MLNKQKYDVVIVGSGPGGAVAALEEAKRGHSCLIIEEGPKAEPSSDLNKQFKSLYRHGGVQAFLGNMIIPFAEGRCYGGGSVINGALLWRTPEHIYSEWDRLFKNKIKFSERLSPHFSEIEKRLSVSYVDDLVGYDTDSTLIHKTALTMGWKSVKVPRALKDCKRENRCPTGCTAGAKQSMDVTYLKAATEMGADTITGARAYHVEMNKQDSPAAVHISSAEGNHRIACDKVVISAGVIQTPMLLKRSGLKTTAGSNLECHFNLKVLVEFEEDINPEKGTMFTYQVQEFEQDGVYLMASNWRDFYVITSLVTRGKSFCDKVLKNPNRFALYIIQVRPTKSRGRILNLFGQAIPVFNTDKEDLFACKSALKNILPVFFKAGAKQIFLPLAGSKPIDLRQFNDGIVDALDFKKSELISVHAMASCRMLPREDGGTVDLQGNIFGYKNIKISDASILPSNIGESPQGTIMALSHSTYH